MITFSSIWNSVFHHILKFFEPHEAIYLSQLTKEVYDGFYEKLQFECSKEIILTFPWNRCTPEKRRKFWLSFRNIETLRIEPILASVLGAQDLYCVLVGSTDTLKSLHICSPCTPLLFNKNVVIHTMKTSNSKLNALEDTSSTIPVFQRCDKSQCNTKFLPACCYFDHSLSIQPYQNRLTLSCLTHIELSGNDAPLWSLTFLLWNLPKLHSLTLQPWTSDILPFNSSHDQSNKVCCTHNHDLTSYYLGNSSLLGQQETIGHMECKTRKDTLNAAQRSTVEGECFFKRSFQCFQRGIEGLLVFLRKAQNTVERIELIVPGNLSESFLWLFLQVIPDSVKKNDTLEELDALFTIVENEQNFVRHDLFKTFLKTWESKKNTYCNCQDISDTTTKRNNVCWTCFLQCFTRQLDGVVQIVRSILFCTTEITNVKTLCFLSLQGCSSGFYVLMKVLLEQSTSFLTLLESSNCLKFRNIQEKSFFQEGPHTAAPMSQNPFHTTDNVIRQTATMRVSSDSVPNRFENFLNEQGEWMYWVLWRCDIVFCGTFTLPPKSYVKCKLYYPLCFNNRKIENFLQSYIFSSDQNTAHSVNEKNKLDVKNNGNVQREFMQRFFKEKSCFITLTFDNSGESKVQREFQRLRRELLCTSWNTFLKPISNSLPHQNKKTLVLERCQSITFFNNINFYLDTFSDSLFFLKIHFNRDKGLFPPFSALSLQSLKYLWLVDWNIVKSPSYTSLFDLTYCHVPCQLYLSLQFNHEHYTGVSKPALILQTIQKFIMRLHSRGCVVKSLTLCPWNVKSFAPYLANLFPITYMALNPKLLSASYELDLERNQKQHSVARDTPEQFKVMLTVGLDVTFFQKSQLSLTAHTAPILSFQNASLQLCLNEHSFPFTDHMDGPGEKLVALLVALNKYRADCRLNGISQNNDVCAFLNNVTNSKCVLPLPFLKGRRRNKLTQSNEPSCWSIFSESCHYLQIGTCKTTEIFMQAFDLLSECLQSMITNVPFKTFLCDVDFDLTRYDSPNHDNDCFQCCLKDNLFVPFLSLLQLCIPLQEFRLILRGVPFELISPFITLLNVNGQGMTIDLLSNQSKQVNLCDAFIFLYHPKYWSLTMSQWILKDFLSNHCSPFFVVSNQILISKKRKRLNTW